ncbi:MAG: carboxypeptidase regulatory-like domain-containing protein [Deltaproteobacteria bacterium]|nr:carboxypeptidase regulatory-like domain-containing protein [Deltaproteobacteria bacterium]
MGLKVWFAVILLLITISCDSKVEEKQEAAEQKLQEVQQMHEEAQRAVQRKIQPPQHSVQQVELFGTVAVWGAQPGTMGNAQGIMVALQNQDTGKTYTAFVDPENRFKATVVPGKYSLTINQPGYELHQEEIIVDDSVSSKLLRPIGLKNIK